MALGDGTGWDETTPTDLTVAINIDDYNRDLRLGTRSRLAIEHEWPTSQSATSEAGKHKFITLQEQAAKPTIAGTQLGAVYIKTVGAGLQEIFYENEAGSEIQITDRTALNETVSNIVRQFSNTMVGVVATSTATIPWDGSIPQTGEGAQVMVRALTAVSATSTVKMDICTCLAADTDGETVTVAAYHNTTANAVGFATFYIPNAKRHTTPVNFSVLVAPGTTAALNYYVRVGGTANGRITMNGITGVGYGASHMASSILLTEYDV